MPPKWKQTLHDSWRMTSGAEPGAVKAASPVLNGEDEETGRKALRLVLTQRRGGGDQTGHVCLKRPTSRPLRQGLIFQESARRALCPAPWIMVGVSEAVWKQSLYTRRGYVIYRARLRTDLLDNRSLDTLLEISKRLIY